MEATLRSAKMQERWLKRRGEAIDAVRSALSDGLLDDSQDHDAIAVEELVTVVHKLAGTAGIFGEAKLGEQASEFERALKSGADPKTCEAMAFELLSLADEPSEAMG